MPLTLDYVRARIEVLDDPRQEESERFARLYGDDYRAQILAWFRRARSELEQR